MLEHFIRDSDNQIKLTLTEDGSPISGAWTELDIWIGDVQIHRTSDGEGVSLSTTTGLLTLTPADLAAGELAAIALLSVMSVQRVQIVVKSALNDDGAVFGGTSADSIYFKITDKPS
jgi:hypothetical protein